MSKTKQIKPLLKADPIIRVKQLEQDLEKKKKLTPNEKQRLITVKFTILHAETVNTVGKLVSTVGDLVGTFGKLVNLVSTVKDTIKWLGRVVVLLFLFSFFRNETISLISYFFNLIINFVRYLVIGFPKLSPDNAYMVVVTILIGFLTLIGGYLLGKSSKK